MPSQPDDVCHHARVGDDYVKVAIQEVFDIQAKLPVPSSEFSTVHAAVDSFVPWPKNLVIVPQSDQVF